jgi:hypothetical protein
MFKDILDQLYDDSQKNLSQMKTENNINQFKNPIILTDKFNDSNLDFLESI